MVEGKCRETWDHTASLLAQQINMNRAKGKSKVSPVEQNPWRIIKTVPQFTVKGKGLEILRDAFVKSKPEG